MHYPNVTSAVFLSRPNRFVAQVLLEGEVITVHVKNTGRCRELLLPGAQVWLRDGAAYFPDAPTQRGIKHLHGLTDSLAQGYEGAVCFVIQMEQADFFAPNDHTHPAFGQALRQAAQAGVAVLARCCTVTPDSLTLGEAVPVRLSP